ncbi:MAG: restriction endonuclease subunit S [Candidatus Poribacteria bacterium]|nr:restriction endonuclease subunit S [Candidatus Poribacteria bacterium]
MNEITLPEHWKILPFTDCLKKVKAKRKSSIPKRDYQESGEFPVIDQGASFIAGWTNSVESIISDNLPLVIFGDHTRIFKYVDFPFALGADGTKLLYANDDILNPHFFYYALLNLKVPNKGYNRHYRYLQEFSVVCPPLPEQRAIAHILQTIQEAKFTRQRELALARERKAALMDVLFSYGTKGEPRKETEIGEIPESWEVVRFGNATTLTKKPRDLRYSEYNEIPFIPMELIPIAKLFSQEFILKTNDELKSGTYFEPGDILLSKITPSFENGKQCIFKQLPTPFGIATTEVIPIREVEGISDISYLFYYLLLPNVRTSLAGKMQGTTGRQRLSKDALVNLQIPLPPLPEQRAIATVFQAIDTKIAALEQEAQHLDELFHAMLEELMTGQRSAVPLIDTEMDG